LNWRGTLESNAYPAERNQLARQDVAASVAGQSGNCQDLLCAHCQALAINDARLRLLLAAWPTLAEHVQEALLRHAGSPQNQTIPL
jgi:hypothetical protein